MNKTQKRKAKADFLRKCRIEGVPNKAAKEWSRMQHGEPDKETLGDYWPLRRCNLGGIYTVSGDGESWTRRWLIPGEIDDETLTWELNISQRYGGPGRAFDHAPFVERENGRTMITQQGGLDI